jgi:hypothetical protein
MISQRLMVIPRGFKPEYHFSQVMPNLQRFYMLDELHNAFMCVLKNQLLEKNLACGCTQKSVMLILGYIYPYNEIKP